MLVYSPDVMSYEAVSLGLTEVYMSDKFNSQLHDVGGQS